MCGIYDANFGKCKEFEAELYYSHWRQIFFLFWEEQTIYIEKDKENKEFKIANVTDISKGFYQKPILLPSLIQCIRLVVCNLFLINQNIFLCALLHNITRNAVVYDEPNMFDLNWLGLVILCIYYARQTHEICQVLPYLVDFKAPGELWNPLSKTVVSICMSISEWKTCKHLKWL